MAVDCQQQGLTLRLRRLCQDEAAFGSYRTRDMVLAYMNALSAGDVETVVAV